MKKLLFLIAIVTVQCLFSQIKFEKGYFINNNDEKTECLIKNEDWNYNPKFISYKASDNDNVAHQNSISDIKEFGIYNQSKYIRYDVQIDRTSNKLSQLTTDKDPKFLNETLFLKVLVEGDENLYSYNDNNTKRFFFGKPNEVPKQLVYIAYAIPDESKVVHNNQFQGQIDKHLVCSKINTTATQRLKYNEEDLTNIFKKYNACRNPNFVIVKDDKKNLHLNARPFISSSSLTLNNNGNYPFSVDFGNKMSVSFGLEAEYILPFNKNKWSVILEPQYQYYKSEKTVSNNNVNGGSLVAAIDYKAISVPIGVRHYMFLSNQSKFFINASCTFNFPLSSTISLKRLDGSPFESLESGNNFNFALGGGYKYQKYSLELRANLQRSVLNNYANWTSKYSTYNLIFGYTLF